VNLHRTHIEKSKGGKKKERKKKTPTPRSSGITYAYAEPPILTHIVSTVNPFGVRWEKKKTTGRARSWLDAAGIRRPAGLPLSDSDESMEATVSMSWYEMESANGGKLN
jgi:hypothetical protein